jgi:hypothetical protein
VRKTGNSYRIWVRLITTSTVTVISLNNRVILLTKTYSDEPTLRGICYIQVDLPFVCNHYLASVHVFMLLLFHLMDNGRRGKL